MDNTIEEIKQIAKERYGCEVTKTHDALATDFKELFGFVDEDSKCVKEENLSLPDSCSLIVEENRKMDQEFRFNLEKYAYFVDFNTNELVVKKIKVDG